MGARHGLTLVTAPIVFPLFLCWNIHLHSNREQTLPDEDTHYHLLRLLEDNPEATQRELAEAMGVSVGKANYLLRGLMQWRPPRQEPESHRP